MHIKFGINFLKNSYYAALWNRGQMENDESTEMRQLNPSEINRGLKKGGAPSMAKIVMRF